MFSSDYVAQFFVSFLVWQAGSEVIKFFHAQLN